MKPRIVALSIFAGVLSIYYAHGITVLFWPDSLGYLAETLKLRGNLSNDIATPRDLGYPFFLLLPLSLPKPALAVVIAQGLLVVLALFALRCQAATALSLLAGRQRDQATFNAWLPTALAVVCSYSGLHFLVASFLPEILFAVLGLLAVISVCIIVRSTCKSGWHIIGAFAAITMAILPFFVKPHWFFAALLLTVVIAGWLARAAVQSPGPLLRRIVLVVSSLVGPFFFVAALSTAHSAAQSPATRTMASLFGPRTVFCNHLHLIDDALRTGQGLRLHSNPGTHAAIVDYIREKRASHKGAWKRLGFEGDLCMFDSSHDALMNRLLPALTERREFYIKAVVVAAMADPVPFLVKVFKQYWYGLQSAFTRFAVQSTADRQAYTHAVHEFQLPQSFLAGVSINGHSGPLGSVGRLKHTWYGIALHALLAAIFTGLGIVFIALIVATAILVLLRWPSWSGDRRREVATLVLLPLGTIIAHHSSIAIAHTFDVWRYAFGTFFIALAFILHASMLLWSELRPPVGASAGPGADSGDGGQ